MLLDRSKGSSYEKKYIKLCEKIINKGYKKNHKNATRALFGLTIDFLCRKKKTNEYSFPMLTYRNISQNITNICEEVLWIMRGDYTSDSLEQRGVNIWRANTDQEYIQKYKLEQFLKPGELGPIYGFNIRGIGREWPLSDNSPKGFDQLVDVVRKIRTKPDSRDILMSTLDMSQVYKACLFPCTGIVIQYFCRGQYLDCIMYQRSADLLIGVPHNISAYTLKMILVAKLCNLEPGKLKVFFGDIHIYENHIELFENHMKSVVEISSMPTIKLNFKIPFTNNVEQDIDYLRTLSTKDFSLHGYVSKNPKINFKLNT